MADEQIVALLREIRTGQQEQIALYRELTERGLQDQQTQLDVQRRAVRLYRIVVSVTGAAMAVALYFLFS